MQRPIDERCEVVVGRAQCPHCRRDHVVTYRGRRCRGRPSAAEGRTAAHYRYRLAVDEAGDRRRERRIGRAVGPALIIGRHRQVRLGDVQRPIDERREVVVGRTQRPHCRRDHVVTYRGRRCRRRPSAAESRTAAHYRYRLAVDEAGDRRCERRVGRAIGPALIIGCHCQVRLGDGAASH